MKPEELLKRMEREEEIRQANAEEMRKKILEEGYIPKQEGKPSAAVFWMLVFMGGCAGWVVALILWALLKLGGG